MYGEEAAALVHFPGHEFKEILLFVPCLNILEGPFDFFGFTLVPGLLGKFAEHFQVFYVLNQDLPGLITGLEGLEFRHGFFRPSAVIPKIGSSRFGFQGPYLCSK
jgi:hypothetical protein